MAGDVNIFGQFLEPHEAEMEVSEIIKTTRMDYNYYLPNSLKYPNFSLTTFLFQIMIAEE